jgi:molybdate transport system substrate-binding protein
MKTIAALFFALLTLVGHAATPVTVSAAASLKDALTEIQALYAKSNPDVTVTLNFGGSGALQQQIENGAPVDVFISAAPKQMDALAAGGLLLDGTRHNLLTNTLVLIAPKASKTVNTFADLTKPEVKHIALGDPKSVPAGTYAAATLATLKLATAVEEKYVRMLDVRQVLTSVETGDAEAGFVYRTDALLSDKVRVVATAPADSHPPIVYPIAIIKDSKQRGAARAFMRFLSDEAAQAVFTKFGFGAPKTP